MARGTLQRSSPRLGRTTSFAATATAPSPAFAPAVTAVPNELESALPVVQAAKWRPDLAATVTILAATMLVAWHRLWLQNGLAHLDIPTFYLPWYAHMGERLRDLDVPGWNPHLFSGTAFAGDPQSGWMYAPAMVIFTVLESVRAYQVYLIFHLALAGLATYAYARIVGLRPMAALLAATAFEFGPFVSHISCCVIHVQLAVWIPVALLGVELLVRAATWTGRAAAWCLVAFACSQMLAGWIGQGAYNGLLVVGSYLAFRLLLTAVTGAVTHRERVVRLFVDGFAVLALGIGLAAAGLWPRFDVVEHTNLAGGHYSGHEVNIYSQGWSLATFVDFMASDDNGFRSLSYYLGAPLLALAIVAPFLARSRFYTSYFVGLTLVASILTLHHTPVHTLFYALLPRYESLHEHVPSRVLAVQWIGPAMLAGIALEMLLRDPNRERVKRAAIVASAAWGLGIVALIALQRGVGIATILLALLACALIAAFGLALPLPRLTLPRLARSANLQLALSAGLVVAVFLDPAGRGLADTLVTGQGSELLAVPTGPVPRSATPINAASTDDGGAGGFFHDVQARGEIFRYIGYDYSLYESGRGYPSTYREYYWLPEAQALLVNARALPLGLDDAQGYNPMQLTSYTNAIRFANHAEQNYHDAQIMPEGLDSPILDMLNVRYIVIPNEMGAARPRPDLLELTATHPEVFRNGVVRILENEDALPRAWLVHEAVTATPNFSLLAIDAGFADPGTTVFLEPGVELPPAAAVPADASENVTITHDGADELRLTVTAAADGVLIVSQAFDSGWNAYVDGERVDHFMANGVIQGIPVPAGTHLVHLVYEPLSLRGGMMISGATGALMLGMLAAFVWQRIGIATRDARSISPA